MKIRIVAVFIFILMFLSSGFFDAIVRAEDPEGEEELFSNSTSPDALILLDLSGSMDWNPAGGNNVYGNSSCSGTFYATSGTGHTVNCSRRQIAKRAIFDILDDTGDQTINSADFSSLAVRIGYMRYYNCGGDDTGNSYSSGCNSLIKKISTIGQTTATTYQSIYCNASATGSCSISANVSGSVSGESSTGGTPLASALKEAKLYLDAHKAGDTARDCRQKFVILISDGADTYACSGNGAEDQTDQYKRRRNSVAAAKALADAGYRVFIIGFGSGMPSYLQNTLNWMAYYGQTDNPEDDNQGIPSSNIPPYNLSGNILYPAGVSSCSVSATTTTCSDSAGPTGAGTCATASDPATERLRGYAFLASDADELGLALKRAMTIIRQANYSFSQSSVQSTRTTDENYLYEGSFEPQPNEPFWPGHLKKYQINTDGTVGGSLWDAGNVLLGTNADSRTIKTYKAGALTSFTTANITPADLGFTTGTDPVKAAQRNAVVGYIRGEPASNPEQTTIDGDIKVFKLGDVFRSTPITVGSPSAFYEDPRDTNHRFVSHRTGHERTSALGNRLIVAGTNAGQFHAFKTADGSEAWSFIPPNLLTKLKNMTHASHPPSLTTHQYFVDGPVTVADVWWGAGSGTAKEDNSWKTILIFGEGRGASGYGWSSSDSCDAGINGAYSTTYQYNCGYYAFNLNDSLNPAFLWHLNFADASAAATQAPYLGDPWSKMMIGRVRINVGGVDTEKWVGFIGAGYNGSNCTGGTCDTRGKGFFVIDLSNGEILWSYTHGDNAGLDYSIPGTPAIIDTDNDTFIDTAYIGDVGGNVWRFSFCKSSDKSRCAISGQTVNWNGSLFFDAETARRAIYTVPSVATDKLGNIWVYWGTGDKTDPTNKPGSGVYEYMYAVKDATLSGIYTNSDVYEITSPTGTYSISSGLAGYRIRLNGNGEKVLADSVVFGGLLYFTTYTPPTTTTDPCVQAGSAILYAIQYTSGAGSTINLGEGIPSAPVLSLKPGATGIPDLYVTTSGGGGLNASTQRVNTNPPGNEERNKLRFWKDRRVE
jgi:hypothetical protein